MVFAIIPALTEDFREPFFQKENGSFCGKVEVFNPSLRINMFMTIDFNGKLGWSSTMLSISPV